MNRTRIYLTALMLQLSISPTLAQDDYDDFVNSVKGEYASFRDQANQEYAEFMKKVWKSYGIKDRVEVPIEKDIKPVIYDKEKEQKEIEKKKRELEERQKQLDEKERLQKEQEEKLLEEKKRLEEERLRFEEEKKKQLEEQQQLSEEKRKQLEEQQRLLNEKIKKQEEQQRLLEEEKKKQEEQQRILDEERKKQEEGKPIEADVVPVKVTPTPQPQPVEPIKDNKEVVETNEFAFYGTPMKVRWGKVSSFKLSGHDEEALSKAYQELTSSKYNNLLHDCLALRKQYSLCDWAYYKMLESLSEAACGKGSDEAVFLQGILFHQSGYKMRFAYEPDTRKLHLLTRIDGFAYQYNYWDVDGEYYFLLDGSRVQQLCICEKAYPGEKKMSLQIDKLPAFKKALSDNRRIFTNYVKLEAQSCVNKNIINFFNDYPTSYYNNDIMTRWAYYANTPVSPEVKEQLYPQLRSSIGNANELMAANILLSWTQLGLEYAYDDKVWGYDRAFFAEESLYYPYCDCEDRSILYSHLVRDLLGLDVVLVFYPGHLYTAVCFNENVKGDYIMVNGRKFTVADPTFYYANVGKTMNGMDNSRAKVILLKK